MISAKETVFAQDIPRFTGRPFHISRAAGVGGNVPRCAWVSRTVSALSYGGKGHWGFLIQAIAWDILAPEK